MLRELESELRHRGKGLAHAAGAVGAGYDVGVRVVFLSVELDARVLVVHRGDRGDAEFVAYRGGDVAAGEAVASGVEGRSRDEEVGLLRLDEFKAFRARFVGVLAVEAVSADDGGYDLGFLAEGLLESVLFSAYVGEELVDVMYNSDGHVSYLPIPTRSRVC